MRGIIFGLGISIIGFVGALRLLTPARFSLDEPELLSFFVAFGVFLIALAWPGKQR
jgi:hypothetical protein